MSGSSESRLPARDSFSLRSCVGTGARREWNRHPKPALRCGHTLRMVPAEEVRVRRRGFGPFVTLVETERPGEVLERWESRRHRKQTGASNGESTWWAPRHRGWWIGVLFAVGSLLFALGAVPGYASAVGIDADAVTFFVGSLFFTSAGFLQFREVVDSGPDGPPHGWRRVFVTDPIRSTGGPRPSSCWARSISMSAPATP